MGSNQRPVLDPDDLNDADVEILDELHNDRVTPKYLAVQLDTDRSYISQRLTRLLEHGHISKPAPGLYELQDDPRQDERAGEDEPDLRVRLQDALEARDEQRARADRLAEELADCQELLEDAREQGAVDAAGARSAIDDLEAALERGDKHAVQEALQRAREAIGDE